MARFGVLVGRNYVNRAHECQQQVLLISRYMNYCNTVRMYYENTAIIKYLGNPLLSVGIKHKNIVDKVKCDDKRFIYLLQKLRNIHADKKKLFCFNRNY